MSWDKTYSHNFFLALDMWAAAVIFNRPDLTISTMCWMVATGNDKSLKLWKWQRAILVWLGPKLDKIQPNHCESAAFADFDRAGATQTALAVIRTMARRQA